MGGKSGGHQRRMTTSKQDGEGQPKRQESEHPRTGRASTEGVANRVRGTKDVKNDEEKTVSVGRQHGGRQEVCPELGGCGIWLAAE